MTILKERTLTPEEIKQGEVFKTACEIVATQLGIDAAYHRTLARETLNRFYSDITEYHTDQADKYQTARDSVIRLFRDSTLEDTE